MVFGSLCGEKVCVLEQDRDTCIESAAERLDGRIGGVVRCRKHARLPLLCDEDQDRHGQTTLYEHAVQTQRTLLEAVASEQDGGRRGAGHERHGGLGLQQRPTGQGGHLRLGQLARRLYAAHLQHKLGKYNEVCYIVLLEAVRQILQQRRAVHRDILSVKGTGERSEALEPQTRVRPVRLGPLLGGLTQCVQQRIRKYVVLERRQVLGRIDHWLNQVIIRLDLMQHHVEKHRRVCVRCFCKAPATRTNIVGANAPENATRLPLRLHLGKAQLRPFS